MKKIIFSIFVLLITCLSLKIDGGTVFKNGENHIFYYLSESDVLSKSLCRAERKTERDLNFGFSFTAKKGECAEMTTENLRKTLSDLCAREVFSERSEDFENVYYYSPKIPFFVTINGKKINLHVSFLNVGTDKVKIASPINYGGY